MAVQGLYGGNKITKKNDSSSDMYPYRVVVLKSESTVDMPAAEGDAIIGVTALNPAYESGVTPDGDAITVYIDGVVDIDCYGTVTAGDYVKCRGTDGKVISAGAYGTLSDSGGAYIGIVGIALEGGSTSRIAVLLRPQLA